MEIEYFNTRKTIRRYLQKEIPFRLIEQMLEAAAQSPNTGNMQLYRAIVTTDETVKERLSQPHFHQPQIKNAAAVITFCVDFNRFEKWCKASNARPGYNNLQALTTALIDTSIFAQQFNTIAELNGLGCCYLGTTTYNPKEIAEILNLPERVVPVTTITVGYPDPAECATQSKRLPIGSIIHRDTYHDYTDNEIRDMYSELDNMESSKHFIAENNKETLAQVFTDVRYTKEAFEISSRELYQFAEKQGFKFPK